MSREKIHLDTTLEELDAWTSAHCADTHDEPYLDATFNPITLEEPLEQIRELEQRRARRRSSGAMNDQVDPLELRSRELLAALGRH